MLRCRRLTVWALGQRVIEVVATVVACALCHREPVKKQLEGIPYSASVYPVYGTASLARTAVSPGSGVDPSGGRAAGHAP